MLSLEFKHRFQGPNPYSTDPILLARADFSGAPNPDLAVKSREVREHHGLPPASPDVENDLPLLICETAVLLAQHLMNEWRGYVRERGARRKEETVFLWIGYHHPAISHDILLVAFAMIDPDLSPKLPSENQIEGVLARLRQGFSQYHPDYQARILMDAARYADVPFLSTGVHKVWQAGSGAQSELFMESSSNGDGHVGVLLARSKVFSTKFLQKLGAPTARQVVVDSPDSFPMAIERIGFPCVTKPPAMGGGKGVTAGILNEQELLAGFEEARRFSSGSVLIEKFVPGEDHRFFVADGTCNWVIRRQASYVTGDGRSSVRRLIEHLNASRSTDMVRSNYLRPIALDQILTDCLASQNVTLDTVLAEGRVVRLRSNANLSTGGITTDVTHLAHPANVKLAEAIARSAGIRCCGLDFMTKDVSRPLAETGGVVIEFNLHPGMDAMIAAGIPAAEVGRVVLGERPGRIPVDLVVAPPGTAAGLFEHFKSAGVEPETGLACGPNLLFDGIELSNPSEADWGGFACLVRYRTLSRIIAVADADQVRRSGLPIDKVSTANVASGCLPEDWLDCIARHAGTVSQFVDRDDLASLLRR